MMNLFIFYEVKIKKSGGWAGLGRGRGGAATCGGEALAEPQSGAEGGREIANRRQQPGGW